MLFAHTFILLFWTSLEFLCHINNLLHILQLQRFCFRMSFMKTSYFGGSLNFPPFLLDLVVFASCPKLSQSGHPLEALQWEAWQCKAVRFLLDEKHGINVWSLPYNILFYNCIFTVSGRDSVPLFFCFYRQWREGRWQFVYMCSSCACVLFQCWSISGWGPEFTNYHFNRYPQRRGRGGETSKENS